MAVVWRPDAEGAEWGCRRSASGLSLCINVRLRTLARSTGVKEPRGKSGEKVQGAREERVNPEASAATAHNWEAGLRTGNMMKDDDKKSASTREDVYVPKKNTKMKWHDVFSHRQLYKFERKLYLRYINSSGGSSTTFILHVFILLRRSYVSIAKRTTNNSEAEVMRCILLYLMHHYHLIASSGCSGCCLAEVT